MKIAIAVKDWPKMAQNIARIYGSIPPDFLCLKLEQGRSDSITYITRWKTPLLQLFGLKLNPFMYIRAVWGN